MLIVLMPPYYTYVYICLALEYSSVFKGRFFLYQVSTMNYGIMNPEQFEALLPLAIEWVEQQETHILASGAGLTELQMNDARMVGVVHPERVRVLAVDAIPLPTHPALKAASEAVGLMSPHTVGLANRYGIYLRSAHVKDRLLLVHELVHTAQYERFGSIAAFLRQYLQECLSVGYPAAALEQEAILTSERLVKM